MDITTLVMALAWLCVGIAAIGVLVILRAGGNNKRAMVGLAMMAIALCCLFGGKVKLFSQIEADLAGGGFPQLWSALANNSGEIEVVTAKYGPGVDAWGKLVIYRIILRSDLHAICSARGKCKASTLVGFEDGIESNHDVLMEDDLYKRLWRIRDITYYSEWLVPPEGRSGAPDKEEVAQVLKDAPNVIDAVKKLKTKFNGH